MIILNDYTQFDGLHWETGTVRNFFAYRGLLAPHTDEPFTEAMLMGISGGVVMGYFSFAYEGYDPIAVILTRNTFDPFETLLNRFGVPQNVRQTAKPEKALANLMDTLENGIPAIVWADMYSLPYNAQPHDAGIWAMMPLLVYGYDENADQVWIADRARVPLTVTTGELAAARARVKKTKFRLVTLDYPNLDKLTGAVELGIQDCIKLFTEAPPKGAKYNFGFAAYEHLADLLVNPKKRLSWAKVFPSGRKMYAGLTNLYNHIALFGNDGNAEREMYADFLDEASVLLSRPPLKRVAAQFRLSARAWDEFSIALLPEEVPLLGESRGLMQEAHNLFLDHGNAALEEIIKINARLAVIREDVAQEFPLEDGGVQMLCEDLRSKLLAISAIEKTAIAALTDAMA